LRVLTLARNLLPGIDGGSDPVNPIVWLPAMLLLGLAGMALCLAFVSACERI
jgi:hypothetical protein